MTDKWQMQAEAIRELVEPLLDAFYAQGKEGRSHDDKAGSAQAADDALMAGIRAALSDAYEAGRREEREAAAKVADAFADENWQMTMDSIINDPILARSRHEERRPITERELAISEAETINGAVHSSMYHAAKNIATAIRSREAVE